MLRIEIIKGHSKRPNYRKSSGANEIDNVSDTFRNRQSKKSVSIKNGHGPGMRAASIFIIGNDG